MSNSKVTVTFIRKELVDDIISFKARKLTGNFEEIILFEKYQSETRTEIGQAEIAPGVNLDDSTLNYLTWVNEDYNQNEIFNISSDGALTNVVIEFKDPLWEFVLIENTGVVTLNIENTDCSGFETASSNYLVETISGVKNKQFDLNVVFNGPDKIGLIKQGDLIIRADHDSLSFDIKLNRDELYNFEFINQAGTCNKFIQAYNEDFLVQNFDKENFKAISVSINNQIEVHVLYFGSSSINYDLGVEYSDDNATWQSSNIFTNQVEGLKNFYVRDNLGGTVSLVLYVDSYGTRDGYSFLSKALGFSFVKIENIVCFNTNSSNVFEGGSRNLIPYCDEQIINKCDQVRLQFKTNYRSNVIKLRDEYGLDQVLNLTKLTDNLNLFESLDCIESKYSNNESSLRFTNGNVYTTSGNIYGYHNLLGNLPDFGVIGNSVLLDGFYYVITSILFDEDENGFILIINKQNTIDFEPRVKIVSCTYDLLPYEVLECSIDFTSKEEGLHDIILTKNDVSNGQIIYQTENFEVKEEHKDSVGLTYYNDNDKDIFYSFGFKNFLRLKCVNSYLFVSNDNQINVNDEKSTVVSSDVNEGDVYEFNDLNRNLSLKTVIALSCDNVYINRVGYIKNQSITVDNIDNTNISNIEADMLRNGTILPQTTTSKTVLGKFTADSTITADSSRTADES